MNDQEPIAFVRQQITLGNQLPDGSYAAWNSEGTFKIAMYVDDLQDLSSGIGSAFPILP